MLGQHSSSGFCVLAVHGVPLYERLLNVRNVPNPIGHEDSVLEAEDFSLRLLRGRENNRAPDLKAVFDVCACGDGPRVLDLIGV